MWQVHILVISSLANCTHGGLICDIVGDGWEHNKMFIQRFKATRLKL
jgi:hypothetical protein